MQSAGHQASLGRCTEAWDRLVADRGLHSLGSAGWLDPNAQSFSG
jgi:hypothetical protein